MKQTTTLNRMRESYISYWYKTSRLNRNSSYSSANVISTMHSTNEFFR